MNVGKILFRKVVLPTNLDCEYHTIPHNQQTAHQNTMMFTYAICRKKAVRSVLFRALCVALWASQVTAFATRRAWHRPALTPLHVVTDPQTLMASTPSTTSRHRHAPIYSLQLINAVPVKIDNGQKPLWRPIVSRVTRLSEVEPVAITSSTTTTTTTDDDNNNQPKENKSFFIKSAEPIKRVLAYRSVLRSWIRRVVGRGRHGEEVATDETVVTELLAVEEEEAVLQSLASQEAGCVEEGSTIVQMESSVSVSTAEAAKEATEPEKEEVLTTMTSLASSEADPVAESKTPETPSQPAKQAKLAKKYGAIQSLEERAFQILKDLGMIEPSLHFYI